MQDVFAELCARLDPGAGLCLALLGLIFGLFGWRLLRYLVVMDAVLLAAWLALVLCETHRAGTLPLAGELIALSVLVGLPWLAWRFTRWAVVTAAGVLAYVVVQALPWTAQMPLVACVLLGVVAAAFVMAVHLTLYHHSAIIVTGLHGGTFLLAGCAVIMKDKSEFGRGLDHVLSGSAPLICLAIGVLSAIMIFLQWADLARSADRI